MDRNLRFILITFLLGVFLGALDSGIISPALTTLIEELNIGLKWSVWVITIYTLVYAVSMPIVGKLSDIYGRKKIFLIGISLFGIGSLISGFSNSLGMLLTGRAVQALGSGGIIPIANAVIGNSFPKEKRGMALGLVGAMFGIATILGPNAGGFFVDQLNWRWIFWVNVPFVILILILGLKLPKEENEAHTSSLDISGAILLSVIIINLLYGLTNIDTGNLSASLASTSVWPYLAVGLILVLPLVLVEKRAEDPILKLSYFQNRNIVIALIISMITGIGIISMIFIPSFSEILLALKQGRGGYVMTILAVASGFAAPIGGILLDKWGSKQVVLTGFTLSLLGSLTFVYLAEGWFTLSLGMILAGVGIGFTMGTPLNYIILELTPESESSVALSLVSLFRSIGTSLGPIILVGFIAASTPANGGAHGSFTGKAIPGPVREMLLQGYAHMYLASSFIFLLGLLFGLLLKLPARETEKVF
ncbi:MFS transporter [Pseudalkalibacillus caeni]|uniref:MFS transporter n=1 Tax=Exobacillus caeni TaxID=2574798 RepID=A0A5R9F3E1_9BACL|nr:MFS transporter [Pseudalkalibacillus caeni]TLS35423.1 MFS transporter [Pseudalkalibacillus caeni]